MADTGYMPGFLEIGEHDTLFHPLEKWSSESGKEHCTPTEAQAGHSRSKAVIARTDGIRAGPYWVLSACQALCSWYFSRI